MFAASQELAFFGESSIDFREELQIVSVNGGVTGQVLRAYRCARQHRVHKQLRTVKAVDIFETHISNEVSFFQKPPIGVYSDKECRYEL